MLNKASEDLYAYLKSKRWGKIAVVSICGLIVFYFVWTSLTPAQKEGILLPSASTPPAAAAQDSNSNSETDEQVNARNSVFANCLSQSSRNPRAEYDVAKRIANRSQRDTEFSEIAVAAICAHDESLANEVLAEIQNGEWKDHAVRRIVEHCVHTGQVDVAQKWTDRLTISTDRDWWRKKILDRTRQGA